MPFLNRVKAAIKAFVHPTVTHNPDPTRVIQCPSEIQLVEPGQLLKGKNICITGAGRNIGRSITLECASQDENIYIHRAYEIAIQQFSGQYRPSGKTFIAHLVGVSSIFVGLAQPVLVIIVGMIYSIYQHGDFGDTTHQISQGQRDYVETLFDACIEELVYRYAHLDPNAKTFQDYFDRYQSLSPIEKEVILIRLADLLEDSLDEGILFCPNWQARKRHIQDIATITVELAHQLNYSTLANALAEIFPQILKTLPIPMMQNSMTDNASFLIFPSYYCKTLPIIMKDKVAHAATTRTMLIQKLLRRFHQALSCSF